MQKILISYRRGDTRKEVLHLNKRLVQVFGAQKVLKDLSGSSSTSAFGEQLKQILEEVRVVIVVIGPDWLDIRDERGNRKIRNTNDILYVELNTILAHQNIEVIPVLLHNASLPRAEDLRIQLRDLAVKTSIILREEPYFDIDISQLIEYLQQFVGTSS